MYLKRLCGEITTSKNPSTEKSLSQIPPQENPSHKSASTEKCLPAKPLYLGKIPMI